MQLIPMRSLWRGLRGKSLVFSIVFAMALMGSSLAGILRSPLRAIGLWWPLIFLIPILLIGKTAKWEQKLKIQPEFRRRCCFLLIYGSIILSIGMWMYGKKLHDAYAAKAIQPGPKFKEVIDVNRPRGPRHRH